MTNDRRVALITGSGRRRVGNVIARELAKDGYAIGIHFHSSRASAEDTVREIVSSGGQCTAYQADVTQEVEVDRMFDAFLDDYSRIDLLVTTAAVWDATPLDHISADEFRRQIEVNTLGTFLAARRAGLQMVTQELGGAIVTFGDWAIQRPYLDHVAYFASKGAIPAMTRALAVELATRNPQVRVNCIHPGPVMLPPDCSAEERDELVQSTLVRRADDPQAIVSAVRFLAHNSFVTGACIPVDGGRSIYSGETINRKRPI